MGENPQTALSWQKVTAGVSNGCIALKSLFVAGRPQGKVRSVESQTRRLAGGLPTRSRVLQKLPWLENAPWIGYSLKKGRRCFLLIANGTIS